MARKRAKFRQKIDVGAPRRVAVSHVYSRDNKGDAALTSVLLQDLKRLWPRATRTILALQPAAKTKFEGVPERASFMSYVLTNNYPAPIKLLRAVYMLAATMLWACWLRWTGRRLYLPRSLRIAADIYARADLIVLVGGGHIRSQRGVFGLCNVPLLLHPLWFGTLLGKPIVLYSQSIGPFRNTLEKQLVARTLKRMVLILLREDVSYTALLRLGVRHNIRRAVDSGFLLRTTRHIDIRKRYQLPSNSVLIGVTVRKWLKGSAQAAYEAAVAQALDELIGAQAVRVVFIPQVTAAKGDDDRTVSWRVYERMRRQKAAIVIDDDIDYYHLKALYNDLDMLLGTRFHSVIFSLTAFVPVVAIEYEHKTGGIMHDLGLDEWVIKIEAVRAENLAQALQALCNRRATYKAYLQQHIPPYVQQAKQAAVLLRQEYRAFVAASGLPVDLSSPNETAAMR